VGLAIAALALTPLVFFLPKATLAATIIVAVLSLVDLSILKKTWTYSKADFVAVAATILLTLGLGVEVGRGGGRDPVDRPAPLQDVAPACGRGRPGPRHPAFPQHQPPQGRDRPEVVTLRVDESLYFANARFLEDLVQDRVTEDGPVKHVVLMCSAVNEVDISALESLEAINSGWSMGVGLHLSEVKGPVMDRLKRSHFLDDLTGEVFLYGRMYRMCTGCAHALRSASRPVTLR
jgi:SulP family sulfate permease